MSAAGAHVNRARADGGLSLLIGLALLGAAVVVVGGVAGTVKLVQAVTKDGPGASPASAPVVAAPSLHAKPAARLDAPETPTGRFLERPHCDAVGGYEAYLKKTGELCRLH
jgi:hypothetical protein